LCPSVLAYAFLSPVLPYSVCPRPSDLTLIHSATESNPHVHYSGNTLSFLTKSGLCHDCFRFHVSYANSHNQKVIQVYVTHTDRSCLCFFLVFRPTVYLLRTHINNCKDNLIPHIPKLVSLYYAEKIVQIKVVYHNEINILCYMPNFVGQALMIELHVKSGLYWTGTCHNSTLPSSVINRKYQI
jgi:hypothetical protein